MTNDQPLNEMEQQENLEEEHARLEREEVEQAVETVALQEEPEVATVQALEEEPEEGSSSRKLSLGLFFSVLLMVLVTGSLVAVGYRVFPTTQKIDGHWQAEDGFPYELVVEGTKGTLLVEKLNDIAGVRLEIRSELVPIDGHRFKGKKAATYLVIDKATQSEETLNALKKKTEYYQVTNETAKQLELSYTKEATLEAFGVEDVTPLFRFEVTGWKFKLFPTLLRIQNEAFATNGMTLERKK